MSDEEQCWEFVLDAIESELKLRRPTAYDTAAEMRDKARREAVELERQADLLAVRATSALERADQIDKILAKSKWNPHGVRDDGPTAETVLKAGAKRPRTAKAVLGLKDVGRIDDACVDAAERISEVFLAVTAALHARIQRGRLGGGGGADAIDLIPDWLATEHAEVYLPWARAMENRRAMNLGAVMRVLLDDLSIPDAAGEERLTGPGLQAMVGDALLDYAQRTRAQRK